MRPSATIASLRSRFADFGGRNALRAVRALLHDAAEANSYVGVLLHTVGRHFLILLLVSEEVVHVP